MSAALPAAPDSGLHAALQRTAQRLRLHPDDGQTYDDAAVLHFQLGNLPAALASAERAVALRPKDAFVFDHLGLFLLEAGRPTEAVRAARRAVALQPRQGAFHLNLGNALLAAGDPPAAAAALQRATTFLPGEPRVWLNLGNALARTGRRAEAIAQLRRAVALDGTLEPARRNLALLLHEEGRPAEGAAVLEPLACSSDSSLLHLLGILRLDAADPAGAVEPLQRAAARSPTEAGVHLALARCLLRLERHTEAARAGAIATRLTPDNPAAWNVLGLCQSDPAEAEACYRHALALHSAHPDASVNLARRLTDGGRALEALLLVEAALAVAPAHAELHFTRAVVLRELNRTAEARDANLRALEYQPGHASARWNLALCDLRLGRFTEGWAGYEGRWHYEAKEPRRYTRLPEWPADGPAEGHLLAWGEQGIGDEVLFTGCLAALRSRVRRLTLACAPRLVPLFQRSFDGVAVVPQPAQRTDTEPAIEADWQIPLGSLPARFWTAEGPPHAGAPWLRSDPERVAELRTRYSPERKPLIGLSWKTTNVHTGAARSVAPAEWAPALALLPARFLSLQYGDCQADLAIAVAAGLDIFADPTIDPLVDLDGFAAQVSAVDAVISIDNSTAHFAGALGRPAWILLPTPCDWRWGLENARSPWYASVRLHRRMPGEAWPDLLRRLVSELTDWLQTPAQ